MSREQAEKEFRFKEFSNLDNSPDADYLIASMDVMLSLESIRSIKERAIAAMKLQRGDSVLEVGCGTGEDAELMAELVGGAGSVTAIDLSQRMIDEANKRSTHNNVNYCVADANQLKKLNQKFSACHADRLLVSHDNYVSLFKEMVKVVEPGGIVCLTDVDALSIVLHPYTDVTQVVLSQLHQCFVNPGMGRSLPELFVHNELENILVIPEISMVRSFETLCKIFQFGRLTEAAISKGLLTTDEVNQWFEEMRNAEKSGCLLYCLTMVTVCGHVPQGAQ